MKKHKKKGTKGQDTDEPENQGGHTSQFYRNPE
jgi:hypothetical protein